MRQGGTPGMHGFQGQTPGRMNQGGFGGNTAGTNAGLTGIQQQVLQSIFCCVITTRHFKVMVLLLCIYNDSSKFCNN